MNLCVKFEITMNTISRVININVEEQIWIPNENISHSTLITHIHRDVAKMLTRIEFEISVKIISRVFNIYVKE